MHSARDKAAAAGDRFCTEPRAQLGNEEELFDLEGEMKEGEMKNYLI
jgi:hypothetical protein